MSSVEVHVSGRYVGVLAHRSDLGDATEFRLAAEYLDDSERPTLGQVFDDEPERVWRTTHRVPPWFSNLLPEGTLRTLLAAQAGVNPERELHLLAQLGVDLPGAVTVTPRGTLERTPVTPSRAPVDADEALKFSLAGMQLKFSVNLEDPSPTIPLRGQGGRWIAKLPDLRFHAVPENECAMLDWAAMAGIEVPEHRLVDTTSIANLPTDIVQAYRGNTLLIRRFDRRPDGTSVHIEDLAQVRNVFPEAKYQHASYESVGRFIHAQCGAADFYEYVRRLVFVVISGNADAHLKNWSLIYPDGRVAALAPAYDLVATVAYPTTSTKLALKLGKTRRFEDVGVAAFDRLAEKSGADRSRCRDVVGETRAALRDGWPEIRGRMPSAQAREVERHMDRLRV